MKFSTEMNRFVLLSIAKTMTMVASPTRPSTCRGPYGCPPATQHILFQLYL